MNIATSLKLVPIFSSTFVPNSRPEVLVVVFLCVHDDALFLLMVYPYIYRYMCRFLSSPIQCSVKGLYALGSVDLYIFFFLAHVCYYCHRPTDTDVAYNTFGAW